MNQNIKIDPYGFREYDARWLYEKDVNSEGITNLGKGLGTFRFFIKNFLKEKVAMAFLLKTGFSKILFVFQSD